MRLIAAIERGLDALAAKSGWGRVLTAFAFGFMAALALPPTNFFPILLISFPALIALLRVTANMRVAFAVGWSFAFGFFLLGLYWIAAAMFVDIAMFWWAVPLAVAGLPAVCAIYYGLAAALARKIGLSGLAGAVMFALIWFLADAARGHLLTGFPWNLEGYAWADVLPVMQITSVAGIYGLTLLTLVVACIPAGFSRNRAAASVASIFGVGLFIAIGIWGYMRLSGDTAVPTSYYIRIVQPNIAQALKWNKEDREAHFQQLLDATSAPSSKPLAAIVWPETASTFYLEEDDRHRHAISARLSDGSDVLTGVIRLGYNSYGKIDRYANSLVAVDHSGRIAARYDKSHLVPFGEYIPFRRFLPIRTLTNLGVDFATGPGVTTLHLDNLPPFSPLICYEAIFPGEVARRDDRPDVMINITNDGWYGHTAGPYQHFASARTRAIEEGLPLIRSANTGVSGMIDPYGRIVAKIDLGETGFIDTDLPAPLPPTMYVRYGDEILWGIFVLLAMLVTVLRIGRLRY